MGEQHVWRAAAHPEPRDTASASVKAMHPTPNVMPKHPSAPVPAAAKAANRRTYTVAKGDSLWRIAEKFYGKGSDVSKIANANHIDDPDLLRPGQQLVIPE